MDFYYISPRDVHFLKLKQISAATLEPVVRVVMDTALVYEFLEKCRSFIQERTDANAAVEVR